MHFLRFVEIELPVAGSIAPNSDLAGSTRVLVCSPGSSIGTGIHTLYFGRPAPLVNLSSRFTAARWRDSMLSSCGASR